MADTVSRNIGQGIESRGQSTPLLPDIGVIAFVPDEWDGPWQSRHQVLTRLSQYFHVVWAEPARGWRELWLGGRKTVNPSHHEKLIPQGFARYRPGPWLPQLHRPALLASWTAAQRVRRASALLRQRGCKTTVFYLWRPYFDFVLDCDSCNLSCYHIVDEYSFSPSEQPLDNREVQLIKRVDQVFIHSPALLDRKGHFNPHTLFVPNGVDYRAYASPQTEPVDLKTIPHPRVGYVGIIKSQLDLGLLVSLANRHRNWSFVLVGPCKPFIEEDIQLADQLAQMKNVYFLGAKVVEALPAYMQYVDVCMMCYRLNDYTKYISPLKLHEYLAGGKPIVGTPIRSLLDFAHVIRLASTQDEWSRALTESLAPEAISIDQVEKRRSVAKQFDWDTLVHEIARSICKRLGSPYREQFSALKLETS